MKKINGWWMPDDENHFDGPLGSDGTYQKLHRDNSLRFVKNWRRAIDIGGHIGTWSRDLVEKFDEVIVFEPSAENRECFVKNVPMDKITLYPYALGNENCMVDMAKPDHCSGNLYVDINSRDGKIEMKTLDDFHFDQIDYIKIDAEGFELYILQKSIDTLERCKPILNIEQKPNSSRFGVDRYAASEFLKSLGAKQLGRKSDDIVFGW